MSLIASVSLACRVQHTATARRIGSRFSSPGRRCHTGEALLALRTRRPNPVADRVQDLKADAKADEKAHKEAAKDHGAGFLGEAKAAVGHAKDAVGDKLHSKQHEGYAAVRV